MSVYKIDSITGITFYKPDFPFLEPDKDVGTNCGLSVAEMNNNFYVLEGNDVLSLILEGNELKLTLKNGMEYKVTLTGGGGGVSYRSDGSILIEGDKIVTNGRIIPWCTKDTSESDFQVTNPVGLYKYGDLIKGDVPIETVLKNILTKETTLKDVTPTKPYALLKVIDFNTNKEINSNTIIEPNKPFKIKLAYKYEDTEDVIQQGYYSASWLDTNPLPAKCPEIRSSYLIYNNDILVKELKTIKGGEVIYEKPEGFNEGNVKIKLKLDYGDHANPITPKKSDKTTESDRIIKAGSHIPSITFTVNQEFTYYYGYIHEYSKDEITNLISNWTIDDVRNLVTKQSDEGKDGGYGKCDKTNDTIIQQLIGNNYTATMILALPEGYSNLKYAENQLGGETTNRWKEQTFTINDNGGNYIVYVYRAKRTATANFKITFNKKIN